MITLSIRISWHMYPFDYNAYYDPIKLQMVFLAGYMQDPAYNLNKPRLN